MGKSIVIRVDESLRQTLERIRKEVTDDMKRTYGIGEITIDGTLASQVLAAKMRGQRFLNFKIDKVGLNKGILKLL